MPEQFLDCAQIGTAFEQMGRGRMPETVRRQIRRVDDPDPLVDETSYRSLIDPAAASSQEHRRTASLPDQLRARLVQPTTKYLGGRDAVRDRAFLAPLPEDPDDATRRVEVVDVEGAELTDADTGRV